MSCWYCVIHITETRGDWLTHCLHRVEGIQWRATSIHSEFIAGDFANRSTCHPQCQPSHWLNFTVMTFLTSLDLSALWFDLKTRGNIVSEPALRTRADQTKASEETSPGGHASLSNGVTKNYKLMDEFSWSLWIIANHFNTFSFVVLKSLQVICSCFHANKFNLNHLQLFSATVRPINSLAPGGWTKFDLSNMWSCSYKQIYNLNHL